MIRRHFLQTAGVATLGASIGLAGCGSCKDAEFIILGGGISGLYLAYLLEQEGREYLLLEGSSRLGGRLFTHTGLQNREVGGRGIGDKYVELMQLVEALDVPLVDITDYMRSPTAIYFNGEMHKQWDSENPNPRLLEYQLRQPLPALDALDQWYQTPNIDVPYSELLKASGRTEEELDIINISANYNDVRTTSAVNPLHSAAFRKFNGSKRIYNFKDGSKSLIEAVLNELSGPVLTDKMVTKIEDAGNCVNVICADGQKYCGSKVVSTLPFSTLRDVTIDASLNPDQKKLIDQLAYTLITQIHLTPTEAYWEDDGIPVDMWTDTPLERVMNVSAIEGNHELACWVNGTGTAFFDGLSDREIESYVLKTMGEIRPSTIGKLEYVGTHKWGKYEYNKGAYAEFKVGQAALFENAILPAGNLYFAGEHTAKASRGIEGAAESAKRVFKEII